MGQELSHQKVFSKKKRTASDSKSTSVPELSDGHYEKQPEGDLSYPTSLTEIDTKGTEINEDMDPSTLEPVASIFNDAKFKGRRVLTPMMLFYFDYKSKLFWILDGQTMKWTYNDLLYCRFRSESYNFSGFEEGMFRAEFPEYVKNSTLIATDEQTIQILGHYHLEYDFRTNSFRLISDKPIGVQCPTVCYSQNNIFCVSGLEGGVPTKKCSRYIMDKKKWISFKSIPLPHVEGSAICYTEAGQEGNSFKLMVLGGYSSSKPQIFNPYVSLYDFKTDEWTHMPLNILLNESLKLLRSPLVQSEDGRVFVFGSKTKWECYELDLEAKTLKTHGKSQDKTQTSHSEPGRFFVTKKEEAIILLDEMLQNKHARSRDDSPLVKSIKDLCIWRFSMKFDAKDN